MKKRSTVSHIEVWQLILLVLSIASCAYSYSEYHFIITPSNSTGQCEEHQRCLSLAELASNSTIFDGHDASLTFLPGDYSLTQPIKFSGSNTLTITGQKSASLIRCNGSNGFEFEDISILNITYIEFVGCSNYQADRGGAITISHISTALIKGCKFVGNHVTILTNDAGGGAIHTVETEELIIEGCSFNDNTGYSAPATFRYRKIGGGAIFVRGGSIYISSSQFRNNNMKAHGDTYIGNGGGAIHINTDGNVSISSSWFEYNTANYGGAIYVESASVFTSDCNFTNNRANLGGAIFMYSGAFSTSNSHFITNSAKHGGAIYVHNATVFASGCNFKNNNAGLGGAIFMYSGTISTINSQFIDNSGGVIYVHNARVFASHCNFKNNKASLGGAIYMDVGTFSTINSHFIDNSGGVIYVHNARVFARECNFMNNRASRSGGGAIYMDYGTFSTDNSQFIGNSAEHAYGGAIYVRSASFSTKNSQFIDNSAEHGGAIYVGSAGVFLNFVSHCVFRVNRASLGGAVLIDHGTFSTKNSQFIDNSAEHGGAIYVRSTSVLASHCTFMINRAILGGAVYIDHGTFSTKNSQFIENSAMARGGAISVDSASVLAGDCNFMNNRANLGGAIYMDIGTLSANSTQFIENSAVFSGGAIFVSRANVFTGHCNFTNNTAIQYDGNGGAIYVDNDCTFSSTNCQFITNSAKIDGGAIYMDSSKLSTNNSQFIENSAEHGGAMFFGSTMLFCSGYIYVSNSQIIGNTAHSDGGAIIFNFYNSFKDIASCSWHFSSINNQYISNTAGGKGGAISYGEVYTEHSGDYFESNTAQSAAPSIYCVDSVMSIRNVKFADNSADDSSSMHITASNLTFSDEVIFNNTGSIKFLNSHVYFTGSTMLTNNVAELGGAIKSIQSQIYIAATAVLTINNNTATYGGGMFLSQSTLVTYSPIKISGNTAVISGGGVYTYQSVIEFSAQGLPLHYKYTSTFSNISNNLASTSGGGMYAVASSIKISQSFVHFDSNRANVSGGAMYLEQNTNVYLIKLEPERLDSKWPNPGCHVRLDITNNHAKYGGGIYVADNTTTGALCQGIDENQVSASQQQCFLQTLGLYDEGFLGNSLDYNFRNTKFKYNTASLSGSNIYGGLLDRCTVNPSAEILKMKNSNITISHIKGFQFFILTVNLEEYIPDVSDTILNNNVHQITKGLISSEPVQVEFCDQHSYHRNHIQVLTRKGETFRVHIVAIDQVGNPVDATIISSVFSESGLKEGQAKRSVRNQCTELEYNVYSQDDSAQIQIYADGPCLNLGISRQELNVSFLPCTCSLGFQPLPSRIDCQCDCNQQLKNHQITNCSYEDRTILVENNIWIGLVDTSNETGLVIHNCLFDYCMDKPINVSLKNAYELDQQCAYNRTGNLCSECVEGLSLVFSSSQCQECSNYFLFLLIPFALAGIALVVLILLLNITVATGTVHGLIFYSNILVANRSMFLQFKAPNFLTVFLSWLNLDLGIETCFYDGMNSQAKTLLQLVFPAYLFLLIILIIVLCEFSRRFSTLLANRNPVAALCTLILFSYSKLLRIIIAALLYTTLDYSDGSQQIVWQFDANVKYFSVSRIPQFIAAFIIIVLGGVCTILLFFGQWLPRCSKWKIMKWTRNTRYNAFIDAYHAPFTPKHRYWMGLLLFALLVHNLVAATAPNSFLSVLSAVCVPLALIMIKLLNSKIYKNRLQDSLETLFLLNLVVLSTGTFYVQHVTDIRGSQLVLSCSSMAISFILFVGIIGYHCYKYILKNTTVWERIRQACQRRTVAHNRREMYQVVQDDDDELIDEPDFYDPELRDTTDPPYTGDSREHTDPPRYFTPPIIRSAVDYSQLREPDLDILDPINTDDYRVPPPRPRVHDPPVITYTVIDAVRRADLDN